MTAGLPVPLLEPASTTPVLAAGAVVGRYRLEQRIGAGGVGQIWRARHLELGHAVAIKLLESGGDSPLERKRFFQEARLSAQLGRACRNIVRVEDHGVVEVPGGVRPYLVMELLEGETLAKRLRREPTLTLNEIATVVQQIARALTVTHSAGIIHRDLKPSNIFLTLEPEAGFCTKLLDFGIARDTSSDGMTRTGSVLGTPGYMSPEQISGRDLDVRADLWSLCAVVFRMLTLKPPFGTGTFEELTARVLWQSAPPPSSLRPELPAALDRFMARGLARSVANRFQTAEELATALTAIVEASALGQESSLALPSPISEAITEMAPSRPQASEGPFGSDRATRAASSRSHWRQPRRLFLLAIVLLGSVAATWIALRTASPPVAPTPMIESPAASVAAASTPSPQPEAPTATEPPAASAVAPQATATHRQAGSKGQVRKRPSAAPALSAKRAWLDTGKM